MSSDGNSEPAYTDWQVSVGPGVSTFTVSARRSETRQDHAEVSSNPEIEDEHGGESLGSEDSNTLEGKDEDTPNENDDGGDETLGSSDTDTTETLGSKDSDTSEGGTSKSVQTSVNHATSQNEQDHFGDTLGNGDGAEDEPNKLDSEDGWGDEEEKLESEMDIDLNSSGDEEHGESDGQDHFGDTLGNGDGAEDEPNESDSEDGWGNEEDKLESEMDIDLNSSGDEEHGESDGNFAMTDDGLASNIEMEEASSESRAPSTCTE